MRERERRDRSNNFGDEEKRGMRGRDMQAHTRLFCSVGSEGREGRRGTEAWIDFGLFFSHFDSTTTTTFTHFTCVC